MNTVETNVVEEANVNEVADEVIVCDYNKLGFTDGVKLIGRSIKNNAKKVAIGAGVVTAVGVGALVAHALKKYDDDSNNDVIDSTAREINVYEDPEEETKRYGVYQSDEELNAAVCQMYNNEEAVNSEETSEE